MRKRTTLFMLAGVLSGLVGIVGCTAPASRSVAAPTNLPTPEAAEQAEASPTGQPTATLPEIVPTTGQVATLPATATVPALTQPEVDWRELPVIPPISQTTLAIYQRGIETGRDPRRFSVIGECESERSWYVENMLIYGYLAGFDDPATYRLGPDYAYLQEAIDNFLPAFSQERVAAERGMNVAQVRSPFFADARLCGTRESPLACEIRLNNPSIVLISMETWFYDRPASTYETYMRPILDDLINQNIVPVLVTAAENHEHSQDLNATLARLAREYDIPLLNFWRAVQPLPGGGVEAEPDENGFRHLTYAPNHFDDPETMQAGWPVRNLTGLQMLDAIWRAGMGRPQVSP